MNEQFEEETAIEGGLDDIDGADGLDTLDGEGEEPPAEALDELAAVAESEAATEEAFESALAEARRELEAQRAQTVLAVARYREALLAADPEVPGDLVAGESIEAVDASLAAARRTVAQVRERLVAAEPAVQRGFPLGAPARSDETGEGLTAAEKIALGLRHRRE